MAEMGTDCGVFRILLGMGLRLRLADDGKHLIVNGLKDISMENATRARELCRKYKFELCAALASATNG